MPAVDYSSLGTFDFADLSKACVSGAGGKKVLIKCPLLILGRMQRLLSMF